MNYPASVLLSYRPARPGRSVLHLNSRVLELVADRVGRRPVLACARLRALLERERHQRVDDRLEIAAAVTGPPRVVERVQTEHPEHGPDLGQRRADAGL